MVVVHLLRAIIYECVVCLYVSQRDEKKNDRNMSWWNSRTHVFFMKALQIVVFWKSCLLYFSQITIYSIAKETLGCSLVRPIWAK